MILLVAIDKQFWINTNSQSESKEKVLTNDIKWGHIASHQADNIHANYSIHEYKCDFVSATLHQLGQ